MEKQKKACMEINGAPMQVTVIGGGVSIQAQTAPVAGDVAGILRRITLFDTWLSAPDRR